ncbi:hypothetical protein [Myxosarcina sp. GI1(2024)]
MQKKPQFIAKVNALMPLAFLSTSLIFLAAFVAKPELRKSEAMVGTIGALVGSAASIANSNRDE